MPIGHYVVIDDIDVSPFVMSINTDLAIPSVTNEGLVQQADLVLSNIDGHFDGAFGDIVVGPQSRVFIIQFSIEYTTSATTPSNVYSEIIFTGLCQHVECGFKTCKVHAGTSDCYANPSLKYDEHEERGTTGYDLVIEMIDSLGISKGHIDFAPSNLPNRNWMFLRDHSYKNVLDYIADWHGLINYNTEAGQFDMHRPLIKAINPEYTGRMQAPQDAETAMGYANHVEVRAMSFIDAPTDGSEQLPSQVQRYKTTDADLRMTYSEEGDTGTSESGWETGREGAENAVAQYGEIWAPVVYVPEQCTYDECRKRALQLLARYKTFLNRTLPAVVGRQPHLETWVSYKFRRLLDEAWQTSPLQEGKAVSTKGSYSSRGWISYIEVAPKVLSDSATEYIYGDQSYTDDGTSSEV